MITVRQILRDKGHDIWSIAPEATVYQALQLMAEKNVGALMVLDGETLVGILSERDYARQVILKGKSSMDTPVKAIMTANVVVIEPDERVESCMSLMTKKRIRHLPVVQDERVIGMISIGDVVKKIISQQAFTIEQLGNYIMGQGVESLP